ncbi:hypothetical protein V7O62_12480 [Methanolobus sp. ZRKC2]
MSVETRISMDIVLLNSSLPFNKKNVCAVKAKIPLTETSNEISSP